MPNSRSRFSPSLIHGLCAIFGSDSRFMRLFQAPLNTCLDSPLLCQPLSSRFALHGLRGGFESSKNFKPPFGVGTIYRVVMLWFGSDTVRAQDVLNSSGFRFGRFLREKVSLCFSIAEERSTVPIRFRFLKSSSSGSGSDFSSWKNGSTIPVSGSGSVPARQLPLDR